MTLVFGVSNKMIYSSVLTILQIELIICNPKIGRIDYSPMVLYTGNNQCISWLQGEECQWTLHRDWWQISLHILWMVWLYHIYLLAAVNQNQWYYLSQIPNRIIMFKKNAFEKRLRKISKQEAANVRLLEKQVQ